MRRTGIVEDKEEKNILVIEDNADTLDLVCTILRNAGFETDGVTNADAAVDYMNTRIPDLLVIDYMLPDVDGFTTLQMCRAQGARTTLAVMLTADDRLATLQHALDRGFDEFLPKPILDNDEFVERLKSVMARRRR
jgi:DNA-binding response OmpR family regulator